MPDNKLVIRRLPPSMSEDDFLKHISPLPEYDYFCFFEANSGLGPHSFSRAYINFVDPNDMSVFRERFDNYVFLDKDGHEYPAVVEQSLWHKSPKNGPFFKDAAKISASDKACVTTNMRDSATGSGSAQCIKVDPDFQSFVENLQRKRAQNSPIQTLEANLDELTGSTSSSPISKDSTKVFTPLIGFVNQRRTMKQTKRPK